MKRIIRLLLAVLICLVLPVTAYAETYQLSDTDLSIQVDDTSWYVFTRDNIENNAELDEIGLSYDAIHDILYNNYVYMDAVLYYENGDYIEFFIRKTAQTSGIANLSNYSDDEVMEFATALAEKQNAQVYSVYEDQYKFARMEYLDSGVELYLSEFCTIVNKENYTFTFQSPSEFTDEKHREVESIISSIVFDVDSTLKEPKNASAGETVMKNAIGGAVAGGVAGGLIALINKKKNKSKANEETTADYGPEVN